ncbi:hypothetical protein EXU30_14685 [Shewanella maritima]|uniref:Rap1a immunity protein domain-containing protein n=1 Tax=Shewanella maritima TaxID=2520507 RepID=A0A411PJS8_9GAMM|nr:hypothetical protein [Shewanella maritima]QBF83793.1 hypothetical protein EXU30_14685 [Shewanella maritima]
MKMIQRLLVVIFTLSFPFSATANNVQDEQLLLSSCLSQKASQTNTANSPCAYYIQGFLVGSLNSNQQYELRTTFSGFEDRAYRTRVGNQTSKRHATGVCIPSNQSKQQLLDNVVNRTITQLPTTTDSIQLLHKQIYQALAAESACNQGG